MKDLLDSMNTERFILIGEAFASKVMGFLPSIFSRPLVALGLGRCSKRSQSINCVSSLYDTSLKLYFRGDYAVERNAASRRICKNDPFWGIRQLSLKDFVLLDIGANVGTISLAAVAIGAKHVYAVEPGPLFDRLKKNIDLNSLSTNITPLKIGLSCAEGVMYWAEDKNNPGNAHLISSLNQLSFEKISTRFDASELVKVRVTTLDNLMLENNIKTLDLLKIDVEGMEWEVLKSGERSIRETRPIVVAETHRVASDMMKHDCMTPMFNMFYSMHYKSYCLDNLGVLNQFIYPNFGTDTFFIPQEKEYLINNL